MLPDNQDQVTATEGTGSDTAEVKPTSTDNPSTDVKPDQSNEGKSGEEGKIVAPGTFKTPDGRELTPEQLYKEYNQLLPEFTRRSQKLSEYEKAQAEKSRTAEENARNAVNDDESLANVDPQVREAIIKIVTPVIEGTLKQREAQEEKRQQDEAFKKELESLESKFNGKDGLPKFDRNSVLTKMAEPGNRIYDPEMMYKHLNEKAYNDYLIKQALKSQAGGTKTEDTFGTPEKPSGVSPSTFEEASRNALSRIASDGE